MNIEIFYDLGVSLVFLGILLTIAALLILVTSGVRHVERTRGGGIMICGPFPIVFGTDSESVKTILLLSIVLVTILSAFTVLLLLFHE